MRVVVLVVAMLALVLWRGGGDVGGGRGSEGRDDRNGDVGGSRGSTVAGARKRTENQVGVNNSTELKASLNSSDQTRPFP